VLQHYGYGAFADPTMSLTFEAGPDPVWTPRLLGLLAEHDVPATFFVTGALAVRRDELVRQVADAGHSVGNLTVTYVNLSAAPAPRRRVELVLGDRVLRAMTGQDAGIVRLPFTRADDTATQQMTGAVLAAQRTGYVVAGFDHDTGDLAPRGTQLTAPPLDGTDRTLLLHDGGRRDRERTVDLPRRPHPEGEGPGLRLHDHAEANALAGRSATGPATVWDTVAL
jgi:biofilm PGA synthesis N-glycosyltransferase PgaC